MSGTYVPFVNRATPFVDQMPATVAPGPTLSGHGPPEGVAFGVPGQGYVDLDSNLFYVKLRGTQATGWMVNGIAWGGGGGTGVAQQVFFTGQGDPTGVIHPTTSGAIYIDVDTGRQWQFFSGVWH